MFQSPAHSACTPFRFFPTAREHLPPIAEGVFNYNHAFAAFLKATNQKKHTAMMMGAFANKLRNSKVLFDSGKRVKVADLGCADSATCLGYLNHIQCPAGFDYLGFDINDRFLDEAKAILAQNACIKKYELIKQDVLLSDLTINPLLTAKSMDLIFVSHLAYYLNDEGYGKQLINGILNLLNDQGIAIFLHEDSTYYFRSTYNTHYKNQNAPSLLKSAALGVLQRAKQFNALSFTSKLHFAAMGDELWEAAKNPSRYKALAHTPYFLDNLNKLSFIVQCDLAKLADEGSLPSFINEMRVKLEGNGYHFDLVTNMQVLVTPQNPFMEEIANALRELENDFSLIASRCAIPNLTLSQSHEAPTLCYS